MVIDLAEHRLSRQLRSASAAPPTPGPRKAAPFSTAVVLTWRKVSPSAYLMVDPRNGARAVIRDTGADAVAFFGVRWLPVRWTLCRKVAPTSLHKPGRLPRRLSALMPRPTARLPGMLAPPRTPPLTELALLSPRQGCGFTRTPSLRKEVSA